MRLTSGVCCVYWDGQNGVISEIKAGLVTQQKLFRGENHTLITGQLTYWSEGSEVKPVDGPDPSLSQCIKN